MATESRQPKPSDGISPEAPYETLVQQLEKVVARLEKADLPLEESVMAFKEGMELLKRAEEKLRAAEKKVEELLDNGKAVPLVADRGLEEAPAPAVRRPVPAADDDIPF